jgi:hypothetical protein
MNLTGHPFIDVGMAGAAALIEEYAEPRRSIASLADLTDSDIEVAIDMAQSHWFQRPFKKEDKKEDKPLFCFLLQEILPGSSWDQMKKPTQIPEIPAKLANHIENIKTAIKQPPIGTCFLTGRAAHVVASKTYLPMLSSSAERPNCYPNLAEGLLINGYLALVVLLSPFGVEKTVKADGKGSECLLYQSSDWDLSLSIARKNIQRFEVLLAANAFETYGKRQRKTTRTGIWRAALRMLIRATDNLPSTSRASTTIWHYNASNQNSHYDCFSTSNLLDVLLEERRRNPWLYREMMQAPDRVCRAILQGKPIVRRSIFWREQALPKVQEKGKRPKKAEREKIQVAQPSWIFQRLYATTVLNMPQSFLDAIEETASYLTDDKEAVKFCLRDMKRPQLERLAARYKLAPHLVLRLGHEPGQWLDYLKAALIWREKHLFPPQPKLTHTPNELENLIKDCAPRLGTFKSYRAAAYQLNKPIGNQYRGAWLHLLSRGAGTWEDFLNFNPISESLGSGDYGQTRIKRDYLLAYLWACSHESPDNAEEDEELQIEEEEFEITLSDEEWDEDAEESEEIES